jgi:threonine dehydrogenase-like Zn-dependent dehydrogenase
VRMTKYQRIPLVEKDFMKALVYHGPGQKAWEDVPDPEIQQDTDAVIRVDTTYSRATRLR